MEDVKKTILKIKPEKVNPIMVKSKKGTISIIITKFSSQDVITGWTNSGWSKHGGWNHPKW